MDNDYFMNLAIWVDGNEKFKEEVRRKLEPFEIEIAALEREASKFHKKRVGSKEYWYRSGGRSGVWRYVCPASKNPLRELERRIERLKGRMKKAELQLNRAVIKPLGKHLVINLDEFQPSDREFITFLELYRALKELKTES